MPEDSLPLVNPHQFLFQGPHQPFGIAITIRIVIAGEGFG